MADRPADLIEGLLDVCRDREDVAGIAEGHLFAQVHADLAPTRDPSEDEGTVD